MQSSNETELFMSHVCVSCGSASVSSEMQEQEFQYGSGEDVVTLKAVVPVWQCADCDMAYTDEAGEALRHEAVCNHLGRLAPREIVALRKARGFSQEQFAALTDIGIASIKRWELGNQIQNGSLDKFLRLLTFSENIDRLASNGDGVNSFNPVFRTNVSELTRRDAANFRLRSVHHSKVDL